MISHKRCGFRTKDEDFAQKIRIRDKRSGFRTKDQDSVRKITISDEKSGFRMKDQDSGQMIRIPDNRDRGSLGLPRHLYLPIICSFAARIAGPMADSE